MSEKNQKILVVLVFFMGLFGFIIYSDAQESAKQERTKQQQEASAEEADEKAKREAIAEIKANRQKSLDECILKANRMRAEETAKLPRDVSAEVYFGNLQALNATIESAKDDCERIHDLNAPLPAELQ